MVRFTDCSDMTEAVDWAIKHHSKQKQSNLMVNVLQIPKQKGNHRFGSKPPMSEPLQKKRKTVTNNDENGEDSATFDVSFPFYSTPSASHFTIELAKIGSNP